MRLIWIMVLGVALALSGCGDDGGSGGSGGSAGTGGTAGSGGSAGMNGSGGEGGSGGVSGNEAPVITSVAWMPDGSCSNGAASDYTVTVTATDDSTNAADLIYEGSVGGCTGNIDAPVSTINCPNAAPYTGSVVVRDAEGLASVPVNFRIGICESGSESP